MRLFPLFILMLIPAMGLAEDVQTQETNKQSSNSYRIQPGDVLDIRFFFNPELNEKDVQVRPDGFISLQLAGEVRLSGKTTEEASKEIETLFAKEVRTPRVSIQIRNFSSQKIYVSGEVPRPGVLPLTTPATVLSAISDAGGITKLGNRNKVVVIRKDEKGLPARIPVRLFASGKPTPEALMPLQPFDVVLVPESKIARADRWVDQWIRQLIPANLNAGFQYLITNQSGGGIPIVTF